MPIKIKIGKIIFEISFPLTAVMTASILFDSSLSVTICFISVLIHELGHIAVLHHFGCTPEKIKLTLFDVAIVDSSKQIRDFKEELAVVLAGVISNFLVGIISLIMFQTLKFGVFELLLNTNFTLAFFNILPVETLDGGQALMLILSRKNDIRKAVLISDVISFMIIIPLGIIGFIVLLRSKYNFSLLLTAVYLLAVLLMKKPFSQS